MLSHPINAFSLQGMLAERNKVVQIALNELDPFYIYGLTKYIIHKCMNKMSELFVLVVNN